MGVIDVLSNKHYDVFNAVCRNGSMTKAALELCTTQPAISKYIKELENFYGIPLFIRERGQLKLTGKGEMLYDFTEHIKRQFTEINEQLLDGKNSISHLSIGVIPSFGESLLPYVIPRIEKLFSLENDKLSCAVYSTTKLLQLLLDEELDFVLIDKAPGEQYPTLTYEYIYTSEQKAICAKDADYPEELTFDELAKLPLLLKEPGSGARMICDGAFSEWGLVPNIRIVSSASYTLLGLAAHNMGVAILSEEMLKSDPRYQAIREIKIKDRVLKRAFYVCYNNKYRYTGKSEMVKQVLLDCLAKLAE